MENRWNARNPVRVNVVVHSGATGLITGRTRDVSVGGLYIDTGSSANIYKNTNVRVALPVLGRMKTLPAHVVRSGESGFAVAFDDAKPDTLSTLEALMDSFSHIQIKEIA
jgi:hypothetical protein